MWSNTWPSAGLLPNERHGLAGPVHPRKYPGIRTPDLDPEAPNLLPESKRLDVTQVGCPGGRSVGSRTCSHLRGGAPNQHREGGWKL